MKQFEYVIITPARNEEAYIEKTIESVLTQTVLPRRWVVVSDGSVDRTDEIVTSHARRNGFIQLVRTGDPARPGHKDFGAKVRAFRAGYQQLSETPYRFVGNLDADITFGPNYFERLLARFDCNSQLGVAGGLIFEPVGNGFRPQHTSLNSVCGAVQMFRRECYEALGGYVPIRVGGVDAAAEIMARMHGWQVQTLPDLPAYAQRRVLTGGATILHTRYRQGVSNYLLGYHPLFQIASSVSRIGETPFLIGSICTLLGYASSWLRQEERALPGDVIRFLRSEQMGRLAHSLRGVD